jgi:hypothetical protein
MRRLLAILALFSILAGCNKDNRVQSAPSRTFQYLAFDTIGSLIVNGWMTMNIQDSSHITGEWHFKKVGNPQNIGPQTGDGTLSGGFDNGQLRINLNPNYVDNNVLLQGQAQSTTYSGTWIWSGYPGLLNRGNFHEMRL